MTPEHAKLAVELTAPAYAGLTDPQIIAALKAPVTIVIDIPISGLEGFVRLTRIWSRIDVWAASPPANATAAQISAARSFLGLFTSTQLKIIEMASNPAVAPAVTGMLSDLVSIPLISEDEKSAILALGTMTTTRIQVIGFGSDVTEDDLVAARGS